MTSDDFNGLPQGAPAGPGVVEVDWAAFRRQMPVTASWAYLDHAAVAPLSGPAQTALVDWARSAACNGDACYGDWLKQVERLRKLAAAALGADPDEIALIRNTTEGINLVARGLDWRPGDNVVIRDDEFPTNQYPWMHLADQGVQTRRIPCRDGQCDVDRLAAACDRRTRLVSISWVTFASGFRHDLKRLAELVHQRGALLLVDAIQGLGVFPLDLRQTPVDFLAADGHKWLLGPEGAGLFYVRREHLERLRPLAVGWNSVVGADDFTRIELQWKPNAARFEGGSPNMPGWIALAASLELLSRMGFKQIAERVLHLTDLACNRLQRIGGVIHSNRRGPNRSGIVSFELPGHDPQQLQRNCLRAGVVLSCRAGRLRISPHAYNDQSDIQRLMEALG